MCPMSQDVATPMSDGTQPATAWPMDELQKITVADDVRVAPFREDFYSGWPTANTALPIARRVFEENKT